MYVCMYVCIYIYIVNSIYSVYNVYIVYIFCIYCVNIMYIWCTYYAFTMWIFCICYVMICCVYIMYIWCIYCEFSSWSVPKHLKVSIQSMCVCKYIIYILYIYIYIFVDKYINCMYANTVHSIEVSFSFILFYAIYACPFMSIKTGQKTLKDSNKSFRRFYAALGCSKASRCQAWMGLKEDIGPWSNLKNSECHQWSDVVRMGTIVDMSDMNWHDSCHSCLPKIIVMIQMVHSTGCIHICRPCNAAIIDFKARWLQD